MIQNMIQTEDDVCRSIFFPEQRFHSLIRKEIKRPWECLLDCIEQIQEFLVGIVDGIEAVELEPWRALRPSIIVITQGIEWLRGEGGD
jgi:hypothetical protein